MLGRIVWGVSIGLIWMWACSGDCASCHFKLDYANDKRHSEMLECKKCHTEQKMQQFEMGGCGQDCFACHNAQKLQESRLLSSHQGIGKCIECHTGLKNQFFERPQLFQEGVKNFLNQNLNFTK